MINLLHGDCLELMKDIPDGSIDMVLCDLPYGTTEFDWDKIIPFDLLWKEYERLVKDKSAIVLFSVEPFASKLRMSNLKLYKYDWIWKKTRCGNVMNSKNAPLKTYENVCVFSKGTIANASPRRMNYNPQGVIKINKHIESNCKGSLYHFGRKRQNEKAKLFVQEYTNLPKNILEFKSVQDCKHPTQKPVDLLEYLIKTYTNEGETVLDNTMGSGSTGVACVNTGRSFIGIEKDDHYFEIAKKRIEQAENDKQTRLVFTESA